MFGSVRLKIASFRSLNEYSNS